MKPSSASYINYTSIVGSCTPVKITRSHGCWGKCSLQIMTWETNNQQNELTDSKVGSMISVTECLIESDSALWASDLRSDLSLQLPERQRGPATITLLQGARCSQLVTADTGGNPRSSSSDLEKCLALINLHRILCCWATLTDTARWWVTWCQQRSCGQCQIEILSLQSGVLAGPGVDIGEFYK